MIHFQNSKENSNKFLLKFGLMEDKGGRDFSADPSHPGRTLKSNVTVLENLRELSKMKTFPKCFQNLHGHFMSITKHRALTIVFLGTDQFALYLLPKVNCFLTFTIGSKTFIRA